LINKNETRACGVCLVHEINFLAFQSYQVGRCRHWGWDEMKDLRQMTAT